MGPVGEAVPCRARLEAADVLAIESAIDSARETLFAAWVAFHENFDDARSVTFLLQSPPAPGAEREIEIPVELFPVTLIPLARFVDDLEKKSCNSGSWRIAP